MNRIIQYLDSHLSGGGQADDVQVYEPSVKLIVLVKKKVITKSARQEILLHVKYQTFFVAHVAF